MIAGRGSSRRFGLAVVVLALSAITPLGTPAETAAQTTGTVEKSAPVSDNPIRYFFLMDQLESRFTHDRADSVQFNGSGWIGGDYNRIWLKPEATKVYGGPWEDVDVQLLYGRLVAPFWDLQVGARYSQSSSDEPPRASAVFGIQGIAPGWFDVEAALFVSHRGEVSARLELEYDLFLTQRLVLQPRLETNIAAQRVREIGMGAGVNDLEVGARLRYEIWREFAPYIGISWGRKFGDAADFARAGGDDVEKLHFVVGVRFWF